MTHRNADTRIREAFDALRAEIEAVFPSPEPGRTIANLLEAIEIWEAYALDFAKLPADA